MSKMTKDELVDEINRLLETKNGYRGVKITSVSNVLEYDDYQERADPRLSIFTESVVREWYTTLEELGLTPKEKYIPITVHQDDDTGTEIDIASTTTIATDLIFVSDLKKWFLDLADKCDRLEKQVGKGVCIDMEHAEMWRLRPCTKTDLEALLALLQKEEDGHLAQHGKQHAQELIESAHAELDEAIALVGLDQVTKSLKYLMG